MWRPVNIFEQVYDHNLNIVKPWKTYVQGRSETNVGMSGLVFHLRAEFFMSVVDEEDKIRVYE